MADTVPQNYQLSYTGQQVDIGITRALENGAIDQRMNRLKEEIAVEAEARMTKAVGDYAGLPDTVATNQRWVEQKVGAMDGSISSLRTDLTTETNTARQAESVLSSNYNTLNTRETNHFSNLTATLTSMQNAETQRNTLLNERLDSADARELSRYQSLDSRTTTLETSARDLNNRTATLETAVLTGSENLRNRVSGLEAKATDLTTALEQETRDRERAVRDELTRASGEERRIESKVDANADKIGDNSKGLTKALNDEISRATNAETGLRTDLTKALNDEIRRASGIESALHTDVDNNASAIAELQRKLQELGFSITTNDEFVLCITDDEQRVLIGIRTDGTVTTPAGPSEETEAAIETAIDGVTEKLDMLALSVVDGLLCVTY